MTGRWRASWENEDGTIESEDLDPLDVISFPPGAIRRFENVTDGPADEHSVLMFVIGGDSPGAEFSTEAMAEIDASGVLEKHPIDTENDDWIQPHTDPKKVRVA